MADKNENITNKRSIRSAILDLDKSAILEFVGVPLAVAAGVFGSFEVIKGVDGFAKAHHAIEHQIVTDVASNIASKEGEPIKFLGHLGFSSAIVTLPDPLFELTAHK